MSEITNDGLTRSGTGCFITAVPIWQQWLSKGLIACPYRFAFGPLETLITLHCYIQLTLLWHRRIPATSSRCRVGTCF